MRSRTLSRTFLAATLLALSGLVSGWAPALRDPNTGLRLVDSNAAALAEDTVPATLGPVIDLVDGATGRTLYSARASERHAIGSLTKLMTALLAIHHLKLNSIVTVSALAASISGSTMWLLAGDRVSVRSLLYGLLIPSGNDAAEQLAETVAGSDSRFARMMNLQARRYGLRCSHYFTPHGLDAPGQYSCAADTATMTRLVLQNPLLARIVSTRHIVVPSADPSLKFDLVTTNLLLNWYPGAVGVKTGTTDAAGASVSAAARRNGHTVIAVVLGSTDFGRFSDAAALLNMAFDDYVWPSSAATMWSTASLESHRATIAAPIPHWEDAWLSVGERGFVSAPFDPH